MLLETRRCSGDDVVRPTLLFKFRIVGFSNMARPWVLGACLGCMFWIRGAELSVRGDRFGLLISRSSILRFSSETTLP